MRVKTPKGATARATLKVGSRVLARASRRARRTGAVELRLKASARALARLGSGAKRARLTVAVDPRGRPARRPAVSIRILP